MSQYQAQWHAQLHPGQAPPAQVEALLDTLPHATLYNSLPWCQSAAELLLEHRSLQVLTVTAPACDVAKPGAGLVAWLPLTAGRERIHGLPVRTLRLLGHPFNDRVGLPVRGDDQALVSVVIDALLGCPQRWDVLIISELHGLQEQRQWAAALALRPDLRAEWRACSSTPVLNLAPGAVLPQRLQSASARAARSRRKLAAVGRVHFERLLPTPAEVPALIARCKAIEDASWKGQRGLGIFSTVIGQRFFLAAGQRLAARGWLDIGLLLLDGQLVSYRFGFRHRGSYLDFNLAFDPAYAALAPGRVLLDEMIASSRQQGLAAVDASRSSRSEPHLIADWTDQRIEHHELWLFRPTWRGRLLAWVRGRLLPSLRPWVLPWLQRWRGG